jgi:hypothetical protein
MIKEQDDTLCLWRVASERSLLPICLPLAKQVPGAGPSQGPRELDQPQGGPGHAATAPLAPGLVPCDKVSGECMNE